ncbi:MAG TPA: hypothetical protein VJ725_24415 [Thermoanaerobaculia bacterium]|nr:hypothetical protein [Thermoanaerobaculia bacterium]
MKTDRFSKAIPRAVLGAVLLFAAALPAAGQFRIGLPGGTISFGFESDSKKLSKALAQQVGTVKKNFDANRQALHTVPGPGGVPAYPRPEVTGLIDHTEKDLDQAIVQVGEPGLDALRAWSAEEFRRIRDEAAALPRQSSFGLPGLLTPRAVAVLASLGGRGSSPAAPKPETVSAGAADRLLDQVGEVVSRIFVLAETNHLTVKLWVGSTPKSKADFTFWPQGKIKGTAPKQTTIHTNGKKDHVLRGLYDYDVSLSQGAVTEIVRYPPAAGGAPVAQTKGERLDLVNGTLFFCCRFDKQYCHHVDDEKECRP